MIRGCGGRATPQDQADRAQGAVSAEFALALPAVLLLLAVVLAIGTSVSAQLRCGDAARAGARWAARGETPAAVAEVAHQLAPTGAVVAVRTSGDLVSVSVRARVRLVPWLGTHSVEARAVARREPPDSCGEALTGTCSHG